MFVCVSRIFLHIANLFPMCSAWKFVGNKRGAEIYLAKVEGEKLLFAKGVVEINVPYADLLAFFCTNSKFDANMVNDNYLIFFF